MASSSWASVPGLGRWRGWFCWLVLCITTQLHLARAQSVAVSTLFNPNSQTTIAINLPPDSDDINFFISGPNEYQYLAIGFGSSMADSLMLVMYASADNEGVTVSPRRSSGDTEPVWDPNTQVTLHPSSTTDSTSNFLTANGTCHNCRSSLQSRHSSSSAPMIFAVGPTLPLTSSDPDARIRRHVGYGSLILNLTHATGPGGIPYGFPLSTTSSSSSSASGSGMTMAPDNPVQDGGSRAATAHGVLYAIAALAVAPVDSVVAGMTLGRGGGKSDGRWGWVHGMLAGGYFAIVLGALVPGVVVSREHVLTQKFRTGHQVLGLLTVVLMASNFAWGATLSYIKRSAEKRGQEPPERTSLLGTIHRWLGRLTWVLFLVNIGLGLKLSEHLTVLILAYVAVAVGLVIILTPVYFCIWRCRKRQNKNKDESLQELHNIYDHNYRQPYYQ